MSHARDWKFLALILLAVTPALAGDPLPPEVQHHLARISDPALRAAVQAKIEKRLEVRKSLSERDRAGLDRELHARVSDCRAQSAESIQICKGKVQSLLERGADPNILETYSEDNTAISALLRRVKYVPHRWDYRADQLKWDDVAAQGEFLTLLDVLLDYGADPMLGTDEGTEDVKAVGWGDYLPRKRTFLDRSPHFLSALIDNQGNNDLFARGSEQDDTWTPWGAAQRQKEFAEKEKEFNRRILQRLVDHGARLDFVWFHGKKYPLAEYLDREIAGLRSKIAAFDPKYFESVLGVSEFAKEYSDFRCTRVADGSAFRSTSVLDQLGETIDQLKILFRVRDQDEYAREDLMKEYKDDLQDLERLMRFKALMDEQ